MSFEINCYCLVVNISPHRIHIMESRVVLKCQHVGGIVQTVPVQRERKEEKGRKRARKRENETIGQKSASFRCKNVI